MITRVLGVMAASILLWSIWKVSGSGVHEDGQGVLPQDHVGGGDEGVRRDDHLIARLHAQHVERP